jgi:GTP cyclohydrolase I
MMSKFPVNQPMEDIHNSQDARRISIDKVGIKAIRHPVAVTGRSGEIQHTVATFNMYVNLAHDQKGTHMSRFVEILNEQVDRIEIPTFCQIVASMTKRLEARAGFIEVSFPFFVRKKAPVTGASSYMDYTVKLSGEWEADRSKLSLKVTAPVTSLCPCSKKISDYGAHNQRSYVTVSVVAEQRVWIEDLIELIERESSCELFGLLKRSDEKYVTESAYNNPKFVEDIVRDIANDLNNDPRVLAYTVETENFESIHNHSAYAMIAKEKVD